MKTSKFLDEHYIRLKGIVPNIEFMATDSELFEALISMATQDDGSSDRIEDLQGQLSDMEDKLSDMEVQLGEERDLRNQLAGELDEMAPKLASLENENYELKQQVEGLSRDLEHSSSAVLEAESAIKVWQDALTECRLEVKRLEEELSIWKR